MAHGPVKKAQAVVDLTNGMSISEVARKHKIAKGTVCAWSKEIQESTGATALERREGKFVEAVEEYGFSTMRMLTAICDYTGDPNFLKTAKTDDVIALARFVSDRLISVIKLQASLAGRSEALPETTEIVRAEIVDV